MAAGPPRRAYRKTSTRVPPGPVATTTHLGPYHLLHQAHEAVLRWCKDNGRALAGPSWEVYGHWQDEWNSDPGKMVFTSAGCASCHTLQDAGAKGTVGPNLDLTKPEKAKILLRVTKGKSPMPNECRGRL